MSITARSLKNYQVEINAGSHTFISDEPIGVGDDAGPSPFDLLLGGLASCTIITVQMYARRKKWPLEGVEITVDLRSIEKFAEDGSKARSSVIDTQLKFYGPLSPDQTKRLEEIANRCPVHRTLIGEVEILSQATSASASTPAEI